MASYFTSKDKRFRSIRSNNELTSLRLKFFLNSTSLNLIERQKINFFLTKSLKSSLLSSVRSKNRCVLTSRAGSVFRYFRLSRIELKNFASLGFLTGVRKSSW